ncbi:MAG: type II toxin-antitoxin system HicB family antitoxin [Chloroflexia bacterium]
MNSQNGHGQPSRYSMIIEWADEDNAFVVTVPELSGCRTHGVTYEEAVRQGQDAIESWLDAALAKGETPPAPKGFVYWPPFHKHSKEADAQKDPAVESRSA